MKTFLQYLAETQLAVSNGLLDRKTLPQIQDDDRLLFQDFLERKEVTFSFVKLPVKVLKPMQNNLIKKKIEEIKEQLKKNPNLYKTWTLYVTHDYRILDGHHRWAALKQTKPDTNIQCVVVNVSFPELITLGHDFNIEENK